MLSGANAIAATCSSQANTATPMPIANQRERKQRPSGAQRVARADPRGAAGAALLEEEREVGEHRAGEREQYSELDVRPP